MAEKKPRTVEKPKDRQVFILKDRGLGLQFEPTDKRSRVLPFTLAPNNMLDAKEGDIVVIDGFVNPGSQGRRVSRILGTEKTPAIYSMISLYEQGLTEVFSTAAVRDAEAALPPELGNRTDLRHLPLVTIDGADARDFDDAVFAEKTADGGHHLIVAIADVSAYVTPGSALDKDAYARGNSTYFPDMVVPMLPEALSNGLCSLKPHEDRACLAFHMWIDASGNLKKYELVRGLMNSAARLTYEQVQAAKDGAPDAMTAPLMNNVINPLYDAYDVLRKAREQRGAIDLDVPEYRINVTINDDKTETPVSITNRDRANSHKLIEEFMILANVVAAKTLQEKNAPCVYRIHDKPPSESTLTALASMIAPYGLKIPAGEIDDPAVFNDLMKGVRKLPPAEADMITKAVLRVQSKAVYSTQNIGHFGLALDDYAHFTSPIRRYADLLVHRSLVAAFNLGAGGMADAEKSVLEKSSDHITETERLSVNAERSTYDRLSAYLLKDKIGQDFSAVVNGVSRAGLFVRIPGAGADGFLPMRELTGGHFAFDEKTGQIATKKGGIAYKIGDKVNVRLIDADAIRGSILFAGANDNPHGKKPKPHHGKHGPKRK